MTQNQQLLDEWDAWCELAMDCEGELFDGALRGQYLGICPMVKRYRSVVAKMGLRMRRHLPDLREHKCYWSLTRAGWNARSRFCWRMAQECEREMNEP